MIAHQRGSVLLSVMIVIAMSALAATTAVYLAQAELAASRAAIKRTQARALAWSGVQAVMAEIADQREALIDGGEPELTREWELFSEEGGPRGVIRLVPWVEDGPVVQSETAKLDLNTATAEMLGMLGLDQRTVTSIIAARDKARFSSVGDLLRVPGFDAGLLNPGVSGAPAEFQPAALTSEPDPAAPAAAPATPTLTSGLADLVTVFSFDPNIQTGVGESGGEHRGHLRINLHTPWTDSLARALDDRFGPGASAAAKPLFDRGAKFESTSEICAAARQVGTTAEGLAPILDALTVTEDPYLVGRVDLNRASAAVLACIPGVSPAAADRIVQAREGLDSEARRSVTWPLVQGILKTEEFEQAVDHVTTRSMQWRVRIEAGIGPPEDPSRPETGIEALSDRIVLEAVIDVASERPRVAYLRDITVERAMRAVLAEAAARAADSEEEPAPTGPTDPVVPTQDGLKPDTELDLATDLDLSSGLDKGFGDLKLGGEGASGPIQREAPTVPSPPPAAGPTPGVDRRVGRWTTGAKGGGG